MDRSWRKSVYQAARLVKGPVFIFTLGVFSSALWVFSLPSFCRKMIKYGISDAKPLKYTFGAENFSLVLMLHFLVAWHVRGNTIAATQDTQAETHQLPNNYVRIIFAFALFVICFFCTIVSFLLCWIVCGGCWGWWWQCMWVACNWLLFWSQPTN